MRMFKVVACAVAAGLLMTTTAAHSQTGAKPSGGGAAAGRAPAAPPTGTQPPRPASRGGDDARNASRTGEKSRAAWALESKWMAHELGLSAENAAKLAETYAKAREDQRTAYDKARARITGGGEAPATKPEGDEGGDKPARGSRGRPSAGDLQKATTEIRNAEAEKLKTALSAFLSADQVARAMEPMGTFDVNWDTMTNSLATLRLDEAKMNEAMTPVAGFVVAYNKSREEADRRTMREGSQKAKDDLKAALGKVLTEEQLKGFLDHGGTLVRPRGEPSAPKTPPTRDRTPAEPKGEGGGGASASGGSGAH